MPLTKPFKETILKRAKEDPEFRVGLLTEALDAFMNGEISVAKLLLRDYVNATIGFETLAKDIDKSPESVMRMLSERGNPYSNNLSSLIASLKKYEGVELHVEVGR